MILSVRIKHFSLNVVNSSSSEVILALTASNSRLRSSFSIASLDIGTEFFFCFLEGGPDGSETGRVATEVLRIYENDS